MFSCPRCSERLERCKTKGGVYWSCARCQGRTATVAMLRQAVNPDLVSCIWEEAKSSSAADSMPCPACRASMKATWLPASNSNAQLDVCLRCHVVWFDAGEYDRIPTALSDPAWRDKKIPLEARLAMVKLHVETLDPRPDWKLGTAPPPEDWKAIPAFFGLPVKHDSPVSLLQSRGTLSIAIAVVSIGLLGLYVAPGMMQDFGFIPAQAGRHGYLTVISSLLLYGSLPHLATSVYFLLTFGDDVENLLGTARFLSLLLASAASGLGVHTLLNPASSVPLLGFGPAVSGLLAAYALRFPHAKIGFIFRLPVFLYRWVNLPAWGYVLIWTVTQAVGAAFPEAGVQQVSWSAHLGGALAGGILGLILGGGPANPAAE